MNGWDDAATGWDDDAAVRAYSTAAFDSLLEVASRHGRSIDGTEVCDFGSGTGLLTECLAPYARHITAMDTSPAMLDVVESKIERFGWDHVRTTAEIPTEGAFDLIVCSSVCGFLDDYPATAAQLVACLRDGGLFVQWDWERDPAEAGSHGLERSRIREVLSAVGLVDVRVGVAFSVDVEGATMQPLVGSGRREAPLG